MCCILFLTCLKHQLLLLGKYTSWGGGWESKRMINIAGHFGRVVEDSQWNKSNGQTEWLSGDFRESGICQR